MTDYAIIGTGMMGQEHIRNIRLLPEARIVGIAEPDAAMRAVGSALAGEGAEIHTDHRPLLKSRADAFVVATPNHTHAAILDDLIADGRPVLVEKPVVISMDEARRLRDRADGAPVWVAMEYRYMPAVDTLLAELRAGAVGRLEMISVYERRYPFLRKVGNWNRFSRLTGGTLVEKCCHFFDLMCLMAQSEPTRIFAVGGQALSERHEADGDEIPDMLDNAYVTVEFSSGVRAMLELCMFAEGNHFQERVSAIGTDAVLEARVPGPGRFEADGRAKAAEFARADRARRIEEVVAVEIDAALQAAGDHHGSTYHQHVRFRRMVREGGDPEVGIADGLRAVAMGLAAHASIASGEPVDFSDFVAGAAILSRASG